MGYVRALSLDTSDGALGIDHLGCLHWPMASSLRLRNEQPERERVNEH